MTYRYDIENDIEFDVGMKMTYVHVLMNITMSHGPCDFLTHVIKGVRRRGDKPVQNFSLRGS